MTDSIRDREQVEAILARRGERLTLQRAAVLAYLQSTDQHPDARLIHDQVSRVLPRVSLGTIYRTLAVLQDAGIIQELKDESVSRYDANLGGHDHTHCVTCGRVRDVERGRAPDLANVAADGFQVLSHRLEVYGVCPDCQDREAGNDSAPPAATDLA